LCRVDDALLLIKQHSRLHYSRIVHELERVWVAVLPHRGGRYEKSLGACVLDDGYVAKATLEQIASTIVHEATHARLARCGIGYEEKLRSRIEAVCIRRERAFAIKLPNGEELQRKITSRLEWCVTNPEWYSNEQLRERKEQGSIDALRYIEAPQWLLRIMPRTIVVISRLGSLFRSLR
jgi:hypothetical protein